MGSVITVICLVTSDCNLNCRYCYTKASYPPGLRVAIEAVETLIKNCSNGFESVEFCWHGGEPLLLGKEFYQAVICAQQKITEENGNKTKFTNSIQSNCLLLNNDLLISLKERGFRIGSTFEAPISVHLRNRPPISQSKNNLQGYLDVFGKIKAASLPLGLLCVVTKDNVKYGEEIFKFFKSIDVDTYSLLPLIEVPRDTIPEAPTNQELFKLYKMTFELWMGQENNFTYIEPLNTMIRGLLGEKPRLCSFASSCLKRMITIGPTGEVIPCASLVKFPLGNIFKESLTEILKKAEVQALRKNRGKSVRKECGRCRYVTICRGGCRETTFWHSGDYFGKYPYCEARKETFAYLETRLKEILNQAR